MKEMRRILAMLLCVVMVVGLVPTSVFAADNDVDYLFIATDRHTDTSIIASMINSMESKIGENELDYLALGGDMVGSGGNHPSYNSSTVLGEVTGATSSLSAANVDIVAGIHDMNVNDDAGIVLPYSGGGAQIFEGDKFYVYGVPESCISGAVSGVDPETEANDFVTWANGSNIDKSKAIIVVSHYPLHVRRNDNDGAVYWAAALNTVAAGDDTTIDRNVAFFWGHNHTGESSADTAVYHVAPGKSISVQGGSSNQTIYFTYANAGYLNSHSSATLITITDDTITFDKYKNSSVSTSYSVDRVETTPAVTLESIAVSGETEYTVGGNDLELTVTASYDDGSTADVTADATFTPAELTASGVHTVTASYGGMTDTIDVKVYLYDEDDNNLIGVEAFSQGATGLTVSWDDDADAVLDAKGLYTDYVVYDLALTNPGETTEYTMTIADNMDTSNLVVYHVADDGTLTSIPYEIVGETIVFTTSLTGAFAYGSVAVPEGYTLTSLTLENIPTDMFVGGSLDLMNAVITATYTKEGAEDFVRELTIYDYDEHNFSGYDVNVAGAQTAVFTFEGVTAELPIHVWGDEFTVSNVTVHVGEGEYGVAEAVVTESTNANVATAIQYVIEGDNYVAYDISLVYSEGYSQTDDIKTVTLPIPEGVTNPVVYYVSDSGKSVVDMKAVNNGNGTVTFTTNHFSTYVLGDGTSIEIESGSDATVEGTEDKVAYTTETTTIYKLVTTPEVGKQYLIVNDNNGAGTGMGNDATYTTTAISDISSYYTSWNGTPNDSTPLADGTYAETSDGYLWTVGGSASGYTFTNGSVSFGVTASTGCTTSYSLNWSGSNNAWTYANNQLESTSYDGQYVSYGTYTGWAVDDSATSVYFYERITVTKVTTNVTPGTAGGTYNAMGADVENVVAISGKTLELSSALYFASNDGSSETVDASGWTVTYEVVESKGNPNVIESIDGSTATLSGVIGTAVVKVTYTKDGMTAWDEFVVTTSDATYSVEITKDDAVVTEILTVKNVTSSTTLQLGAVVSYAISETESGTVENPTVTWSIPSDQQGIATVDANGLVTFKGVSGTVTVTASYQLPNGNYVTDTVSISANTSNVTVPADGTDDFPDYPNEGAIRHDKTATAVGNFSETGIAEVELSMKGVPYTTGSEIDVVVMLDMTGSMSDDGMEAAEEATKAFVAKIVKNEDGSYNENRVAVYAFNSGSSSPYELVALSTIDSDSELETANTAIDTASNKKASGGTPFDEAAQKCYDVLQAAKTDGTGNDRQQFCVFMSDGGPTSYAADDGDGTYTTITNSGSGTTAITTYFSGYNSSTSSSWSFTLPSEYYTNLMKADGVTVYTVGLLLQNKPSNPSPYSSMTSSTYDSTTDSLTTIGSHYYFTSRVLKQMASDESKYIDIFNVDNADKATAAFESIAKDILAAATDVTVADKMGANYTMVFDAPNAAVDAADGAHEYYIEVKEYELTEVTDADGNITDYVRGDATSLQKLYFGYNASTGYYAATDANGTAAATPTFDTVTLGDKGTKYYWTTVAADGDSGVSVVGADGTTYYFVSSGDGTHNMTAGAYASGTKTSVTLTHDDGTTSTSATCQNMIIASPYFVYNAATKMLIWTAEEISSSELTLTYFLYLNNSGGFSGSEQEITPATYKTNQFAYINYTNFQGTDCQLTFPVPQLTWNGAQVSYVFYLVNEGGQPVNRAGRVIPFSEAVYVTDVQTYSIIWNDLEQTAGLEADRLAVKLVPDVYELFDQGAEYNIHVYEDYEEVNLNNHFVIASGVDSDDSTTNNGVYTTYVFNTKADAKKYSVPGTYVADNGNSTAYQSGQSYWCKSYDVTGTFTKTEHTDELYGTYYTYVVDSAAYSGSATQVPASSMESTTGGTIIDGYVYYVDENEEIYTIVQKSDGNEVEAGFDFSNTTVAFAVVWKPELATDTVVIDYGLDVVIDVSLNDNMAGGLAGVMSAAPAGITINSGTYDNAAGADSAPVYLTGTTTQIGTASVVSGSSIRVALDKELGMQMTKAGLVYYESDVSYYDTTTELERHFMYSSVLVIPATTVYYEDDYVTYEVYTDEDNALYEGTDRTWETAGSAASKTQDVDRPGFDLLSKDYDANNVYGYDSAYTTMTEYSMGSARKLNVDSTYFGKAKFSFYGTGFDVISLTSNQTGSIVVQVMDATGTVVKNKVVDTYYGYTLDDEGQWVTTTNTPNSIYQVPVITVEGLTYGKYDVVITAAYNKFFAHNGATSYDFYLDAIRIYDPVADGTLVGTNKTGNNVYIEDIYKEDNEYAPDYIELRDNVIAASNYAVDKDGNVTAIGTDLAGPIFIDGNAETAVIADYVSYGPNNELYLASGQSIAFQLTAENAADVQLGMKVANGGSASYTINSNSKTLTTTTDMYYSIKDYVGGTITITNNGAGILSLTNIKVTTDPDANAVAVASFDEMDGEEVGQVLMMMRRAPVVEEEIPEVTEPEATEPEATEPEATEPEATEPEEIIPEETVPEVTEPEATEPEATEPEVEETVPETSIEETITNAITNVINKITNALSNLFGRWFR